MSNSEHPLTPDLIGETLGVAGDVPINDSQLEDLTFDHDGTGVIRVTRWSLEDDELASRRFQIVVRDDLTSDRPMSSAEFRVLRENLGLTTQWIAAELQVHHRTARRWDDGELAVPPRAATQLRAWHAAADAAVAAAVNNPNSELVVRRTDDPASPWPARWQRHVLARVAAQRPDVTIRFAHVEEEHPQGHRQEEAARPTRESRVMTDTKPSVADIESLSRGQVARVVDVFEQEEKTQSFVSGMGVLSTLINHDDPMAKNLDNAAKKHDDDTARLLYAVRWAYRANLYADNLSGDQIEALTAPWKARN